MSILLKLTHKDGLRLRQQGACKVERNVNGVALKGLEWKFDPDDCKQDEDQRKRDQDGRPIKLGTYSVHITANLKNLVIERKGSVESVDFRNSALRNQLRVQYQALTETRPAQMNGEKVVKSAVKEWKNSGPAQYVAPNTFTGVFVGDGQRAIIDEMPT